jgi:peptide chain release factor subunit 1
MSSGYSIEESNADRNVEIWKIKKLIKSLEAARGLAQQLISVYIYF